MRRVLKVATVLLLGGAQEAWAHPGHGFVGTVESAAHWLSSIDHALTVMAVLLALGAVARVRSTRRRTS